MYKYRIPPARENSDVKIIVESIVGPTGGSDMFLQKATAKHERLVTLHIGSRHIQQSCSPVGELGVYRTDHYKNKRKVSASSLQIQVTIILVPVRQRLFKGVAETVARSGQFFPQIFVEICNFLTRAGQMPIGEPNAPAIPAAVMISHPGMKGTFTFIFVTLSWILRCALSYRQVRSSNYTVPPHCRDVPICKA